MGAFYNISDMVTMLQHKNYAKSGKQNKVCFTIVYISIFSIHLPAMTAEQLKAMRDRLYVLGGFL